MQYHIIRQSSNPKVTGLLFGDSQAKIERSGFSNPDNYDKLMDFFFSKYPSVNWASVGKFPDFTIELEHVVLHPNSKLTDFISYSPNLRHGANFIVSNRALDILKAHNLPEFRIYDIHLFLNGMEIFGYKLLFGLPLPYEVIDFNRTSFYEGLDHEDGNIFSVSSGVEFQRLKSEKIFAPLTVSFNDQFDNSLDYFSTKISGPIIFISSKLKDAFESKNISGLTIIQAQIPKIIAAQN